MKTVRDICKYIGGVISVGAVCVETGCTFAVTPENLVNTTTNNIFRYIVKPGWGVFYSLDIDASRIEIAKTLIPSEYLDTNSIISCKFKLGDSVESLKKINSLYSAIGKKVNLLCLDSAEDADHLINEYNAIKDSLAPKHFVLVDDIHNPSSVKYKKIVPLLKELGYSYIEVPTPVGMFVASKGYALP